MSLEQSSLQPSLANSLTLLPQAAGLPGGAFSGSKPVVAGSHSSCEIFARIRGLSKRHALFTRQSDGRWWVYDLHSSRGLKVNGRRVTSQALENGDTIDLGGCVWRVEIPPRGSKRKPERTLDDPLREFTDLKRMHHGLNGTLYQAQWKQREVALKIFPANFATDRNAVRRLKKRLPLVGHLHHDNIVRLYRGGRFRDRKNAKRWFLASEYMIGGSLRDRLSKRSTPLPLSDAVKLALDVAHGLKAAEELGLRHRNVSPSCILFDEEGRAKLGDFLYARSESDTDWTAVEVSKLEVIYRPPEQIRGKEELTPAADLYSLAVCLYEAVTLKSPYRVEERSVLEVVQSIREDRPASPLEYNESLPPKFAELILNTLAKDPARRPADAAEFLKRLAGVMG